MTARSPRSAPPHLLPRALPLLLATVLAIALPQVADRPDSVAQR